MPEPIKVLHIITNLPIGGAQDNTLLTVERLDRSRYEVKLMCAPEGQWVRRALRIPDLELIFVDELVRPIRLIHDLVAFVRIYRHIRRERYDIVHTHSSKPGFLGRLAAFCACVPIIVHTIHGFPFHDFMHPLLRRFYIRIERLLSRMTDCLVTVSKLNLEKAVELGIADRDKFINVYSGIDFQKFNLQIDTVQKKQELGLRPDEVIVGMVGRLSKQKAPWLFLRAVPLVLRRFPQARFLIAGSGELMEEMQSLASDLGISERVSFLGFRDDIPAIMQIMDVYVLTSQWEGLGRSLTEAMYLGLPVVATEVEGVPELVKHNHSGILVPPNDVPAIAGGIIDLLAHPRKRHRLGEQAKKMVDAAFQAERMVRDLEEIYEDILLAKKLRSTKRQKRSRDLPTGYQTSEQSNDIKEHATLS